MTKSQTPIKATKLAERDPRMRFMQRCLKEQIVTPTDTQALVYDNRLDHIPRAAMAAGKLVASQAQMKGWWREFLCAKFNYLAQILEAPTVSDVTAAKQAGHTGREWKGIYTQWREQADAERLVYQLRLSQGPSAEGVARTWYPDVVEFHRWAQLCQANFAAALSRVDDTSPSYADHRIAGGEQGPSFPAEQWASRLEARAITHVADRLRSGLEIPDVPDQETLEWITREASQISDADEGDAGRLIRLPVYRSIVRVAKDFVAITRDPAHDADAHIQSLIGIVKDEFKCKECDFLSVNEDKDSLGFTASTASVNPEQQRLLQAEQYSFGHGITGSLLLATLDCDTFCVGTNNLDEDERQSPGHRHAFEGPYGAVANFWVFPIWHQGHLLGGFRVITRLEEDQKTRATAGWPLYVRLQLSALAKFVSELWEYLGEGSVGRASRRVEDLDKTRETLTVKLGINEVSPRFLEAILEHIETVDLMRIEKRHMGVCIGIVPDQAIFSELREYAVLDSNELRREAPNPAISGCEEVLRWCSRLYNKVAPTYGIFAFDLDGQLLGVYDLRYRNGKAGIDAIESLSDHDGVTVVLLQRDSSSAGIYREGKKKAEYLLYERFGEWRLRIFDDLRRVVGDVATLQKKVLGELIDSILHLSYHRVGALVVAGPDLVSRLDASGFRIDARLSSMGPGDFENWAKEDGAVLMSQQGMVEIGGCILNVAEDLVKPDIRRQIERDQKGGRHQAAARASAAFVDALVLVVSENRGITVFSGGNIVLWDA
jgi:DisA bacterial checkpoint controller nucleotide-binding